MLLVGNCWTNLLLLKHTLKVRFVVSMPSPHGIFAYIKEQMFFIGGIERVK